MKLLLHSCCGPCTLFPLEILEKDHEVHAYFFNPNIHPFKEFIKRKKTLEELCTNRNIPLVSSEEYGLVEFVRKVAFIENNRCTTCYTWRLEETVKMASEGGFEGFSTTLLYSRYQNHDSIRKICTELSTRYKIPFVYQDFRVGWQAGIDQSRDLGMYRQPYCGCIYSEQERYDKSFRKK